MKCLKLIAGSCLFLGLLVPSVAYAQQLPKVWVGGPNPAPCYNTVEVHGKYVNHKIACYEVRPSTIALSEDGNGFLSDLHWTTWSVTNAVGTGTKYQRCYFPLGNQGPRCVGKLGGGYNVPVTVFLAKPVQTVDGLLFSVLTEAGQTGQTCVTPFGTGCNVPPPTRTTTTASSVSGLAGSWEYVGDAVGCKSGCFMGGTGLYAVDIVRLTIVDFPPGTLSGEWEEVSCVAGGRYFDVADSSIFQASGNKERASSAIAGSGTTKSFTIALTATEDLSGTQTLSGGVGSVPFGVSNKYGFHPFLGTQGFAKPQLFLLDGTAGAYLFYPASSFPAVGACGRIV